MNYDPFAHQIRRGSNPFTNQIAKSMAHLSSLTWQFPLFFQKNQTLHCHDLWVPRV